MKNGIVIERLNMRNNTYNIYIRGCDDKVYLTTEHEYLVPFQRIQFEETDEVYNSPQYPNWIESETYIYKLQNVIIGEIDREKNIIGGRLLLSSKTMWGINSKGMKKYSFIPHSRCYPRYCVASTKDPTQIDEYVRVEITPWNPEKTTMPMGILVETLGKVTDTSCYTKTLLSGYLLTTRSRNKTYKSKDISSNILSEKTCIEYENSWIRIPSYSIDPPGCMDIDDALSFNSDTDELAVHIASPVGINLNTLIQENIKHQTKTIYLNDILHLLPDTIVKEFSLCEGFVRPCLSVVFPKNKPPRLIRSHIKVTKNLSYDNMHLIDLKSLINAIQSRFGYTDDPHTLVENCMVYANRYVAEKLVQNMCSSLLRVAKKGERAWYKIGNSDDIHSYFGSIYTHFTSPLRRYADQLVHEMLLYNKRPKLTDIHTLNRSQLIHSLFISELNVIKKISKLSSEKQNITLQGVMIDIHSNYGRIQLEDGSILSVPLFRHNVADYFEVTKHNKIAKISYFPDPKYYFEWELHNVVACNVSWNRTEGLQGILYEWNINPNIQNWIRSLF